METGADLEPLEVAQMLADGSATVVDVREPYEWDGGRADGTIHIGLAELSARAGEIAQDRPVVFVCRTGSRSGMATQAFRASGFDAHNMRGGLVEWVAAGLPLVPDGGHVVMERPRA
jgi:rhodanese-related sulfurtransferase